MTWCYGEVIVFVTAINNYKLYPKKGKISIKWIDSKVQNQVVEEQSSTGAPMHFDETSEQIDNKF